jgi:hypothetical protein
MSGHGFNRLVDDFFLLDLGDSAVVPGQLRINVIAARIIPKKRYNSLLFFGRKEAKLDNSGISVVMDCCISSAVAFFS